MMYSELIWNICFLTHISQYHSIGFCCNSAVGKCKVIAASEFAEEFLCDLLLYISILIWYVFLDKNHGLMIALSLVRNYARIRLIWSQKTLDLVIVGKGRTHRNPWSLDSCNKLYS